LADADAQAPHLKLPGSRSRGRRELSSPAGETAVASRPELRTVFPAMRGGLSAGAVTAELPGLLAVIGESLVLAAA
jgi:hypothetical protein